MEEDPREENDLARVKVDLRDRLELPYYHWLEETLGNRPDPLRVETAKQMLLSQRVRASMNEFRARRQAAPQETL